MKSERDLFLDTIKEIVETNNWDGNKDKKIKYLQSQLDQQKAMWQKLKKWLEEQQNNFKLISKTLGKADYVLLSNCIKSVLSEMAKLEGEDE